MKNIDYPTDAAGKPDWQAWTKRMQTASKEAQPSDPTDVTSVKIPEPHMSVEDAKAFLKTLIPEEILGYSNKPVIIRTVLGAALREISPKN